MASVHSSTADFKVSDARTAMTIAFGTENPSIRHTLCSKAGRDVYFHDVDEPQDESVLVSEPQLRTTARPQQYPTNFDALKLATQVKCAIQSQKLAQASLVVTVLGTNSDLRLSHETVPQQQPNSSIPRYAANSSDQLRTCQPRIVFHFYAESLASYYEAVTPSFTLSTLDIVQYSIGFICFLLGLALTVWQGASLQPFNLRIGASAFNLFYTLFAIPFFFRQRSSLALPSCFFMYEIASNVKTKSSPGRLAICGVTVLAWAREAANYGQL